MANLSVIIPVYNEENTLQESYNRLNEIDDIVTQIIIVDDCSSDSSLKIINDIKKQNSKVTVLKNPKNLGKGAALMNAQDYITTDFVVIHDADLEYFPKDLKKMYELIKKNNVDLVIGSRFINSNKEMVYFRTYYANKFLSKVFSLIYRQNVTDVATCYKMMNSNYFKNIQLQEKGFSIEVELLAKYFNKNNKFLEASIDYSGRTYKEGKKIKISDGFKYLWTMIKYKRF
ncbi:glycosyltransferase family 2 protein [Acidimicrobiia bacterium]|nr:glycosyltransferase family 2 protein [Acidimicrobiia bacterium]